MSEPQSEAIDPIAIWLACNIEVGKLKTCTLVLRARKTKNGALEFRCGDGPFRQTLIDAWDAFIWDKTKGRLGLGAPHA